MRGDGGKAQGDGGKAQDDRGKVRGDGARTEDYRVSWTYHLASHMPDNIYFLTNALYQLRIYRPFFNVYAPLVIFLQGFRMGDGNNCRVFEAFK